MGKQWECMGRLCGWEFGFPMTFIKQIPWMEDETTELADSRTILCVLVTKRSWRGITQYCLKFNITWQMQRSKGKDANSGGENSLNCICRITNSKITAKSRQNLQTLGLVLSGSVNSSEKCNWYLKNCFFPSNEIEIMPFNKSMLCLALRYKVSGKEQN